MEAGKAFEEHLKQIFGKLYPSEQTTAVQVITGLGLASSSFANQPPESQARLREVFAEVVEASVGVSSKIDRMTSFLLSALTSFDSTDQLMSELAGKEE